MVSQRLALDFLEDLLASILLKPFASIPEGPPESFVLSAALLSFLHLFGDR